LTNIDVNVLKSDRQKSLPVF